MALDNIESWIGSLGAAAGLTVLAAAVWRGVWLGLKRPPGRKTGSAAIVLRPPLQLTIGLLWFAVCFILWQPILDTLPTFGRVIALILGTLLYFPGLGLYLWGANTLKQMYQVSSSLGVRLNAGHQLVTHGPFAFVRHPLYLGLQISAFGGLLLYRTWTFVFILASFLGLVTRARREEEALALEFDRQWKQYTRNVPAWFPRFRRKSQ